VNHSWLYDEQQLLKQPDSMLKKKNIGKIIYNKFYPSMMHGSNWGGEITG
jgi:hypothetical protein